MTGKNIIFFSVTLRRFLGVLAFAWLIFIRSLRILLRFRQRLRVLELNAEDHYLLSNGILLLRWKIKNILWIRVNGIRTTNRHGILLHFDRLNQPIQIRIRGLWGKRTIALTVQPQATIHTHTLHAPRILSLLRSEVLKNGWPDQIQVRGFRFPKTRGNIIHINTIQLHILEFKLDPHEQTVLHHTQVR